jgi:hypothetical protein
MHRHVIWHLTDIHFNKESPGPDIEARRSAPRLITGPSQHLDRWLETIESAKDHLRSLKLCPDWILCSGDLASRDQGIEIDSSIDFLANLRGKFGLPNRRVVVVPGNHDVNLDEGLLAGHLAKIEAAEFASPQAPPTPEEATAGILPVPINTAALIGRSLLDGLDPAILAPHLKSGGLTLARKVLTSLPIAYPDLLRHRAGLVEPRAMSRLLSVVGKLRKDLAAHPGLPFPVVVCHHPVVSPPCERADADPEDTTVLMSLFKHSLLKQGVQLVLQGHVHEAVAQAERLLGDKTGRQEALVALTGPPLWGAPSRFVCIEVVRSDNGDVRYITARLWSPDSFASRDDLTQIWFRKTLLSPTAEACRLVRKVLRLEGAGFSRVDYYYHNLGPAVAQEGINLDLRPFGGAFTGPPVPEDIGERADKGGPELRFEGLEPDDCGNINAMLQLRDAKDATSVVVRVTAQGVHALYQEEAALMRGIGHERWRWELTDFTCGVPTRLLDLIVRFPSEAAVPHQEFHLAAFERDVPDPLRAWRDKSLKHLRCLDEKVLAIWPTGHRVTVQVPQPLPDLVYCLAWELPLHPRKPAAGDRAFSKLLRDKLLPARVDPWAIAWGTYWDPKKRGSGQRGVRREPWRAFQRLILPIVKVLLDEVPELAGIAQKDRLEISLSLPDAAWGDKPIHPSTVQTIAAIGPRGCEEWARWRHAFRYGVGVVGRCLRTSRTCLWPDPSGERGGANSGFIELRDNGKLQTWLCCLPGVPTDGSKAACVVSIGGYAQSRAPEALQDFVRLKAIASRMWAAVNRALARSGIELRLEHEEPTGGQPPWIW